MFVSRVNDEVRVETPAKVNLFLEVLSRRNDGFHEIETLMAAISIYDTLIFSENSENEVRLGCAWAAGWQAQENSRSSSRLRESLDSGYGDLPQGSDNLVVRALETLRRRAGVDRGVTVQLVKRIPSAAGLGGGSSDAAAALIAANDLWQLHWTRNQLQEVATELGSDIAYFLGSPTAICRGRGERLEAVDRFTQLHLVIVKPPFGLSTAEVYQQCQPAKTARSPTALLQCGRIGDLGGVGLHLFNRLERSAQTLTPWIDRMKNVFDRFDFVGHQMTGSGTSYFGICHNAYHARRTAAAVRSEHLGRVFCASTLTLHAFPLSASPP